MLVLVNWLFQHWSSRSSHFLWQSQRLLIWFNLFAQVKVYLYKTVRKSFEKRFKIEFFKSLPIALIFFFHHEIINVGGLFHWHTDTLWKNEHYLPCNIICPISMIQLCDKKACNWNITRKVTPVYSEKINLEVTFRIFFQDLPQQT